MSGDGWISFVLTLWCFARQSGLRSVGTLSDLSCTRGIADAILSNGFERPSVLQYTWAQMMTVRLEVGR